MARLFITPREIDLISDLQKELNKDVVGAKIYYYSVREDLTQVHDIYEEAIEKIFDPPIEIDSRVEWQQKDIVTDRFGQEGRATITAWVHYRDAVDRDIDIREGDYFSFGDNFFEIVSQKYDSIIFGQVEHVTGYFLTAKQARRGQIDFKPHGPTEENFTDPDAIQDGFKQKRGHSADGENPTGDLRQLQRDGVLDEPISVPREVRKVGNKKSSFYGDDC